MLLSQVLGDSEFPPSCNMDLPATDQKMVFTNSSSATTSSPSSFDSLSKLCPGVQEMQFEPPAWGVDKVSPPDPLVTNDAPPVAHVARKVPVMRRPESSLRAEWMEPLTSPFVPSGWPVKASIGECNLSFCCGLLKSSRRAFPFVSVCECLCVCKRAIVWRGRLVYVSLASKHS